MEVCSPVRTVGLDVGDRKTQFCVLDGRGAVVEEGRLASTRAAFEARFGEAPRARVVLEVGAQSAWITRTLEGFGHEVLVANSYRMGQIYKGQDKSDRKDAETLARIGRSDPTLLRPIRHRSATVMADRALLRSRGEATRLRDGAIREACSGGRARGAPHSPRPDPRHDPGAHGPDPRVRP